MRRKSKKKREKEEEESKRGGREIRIGINKEAGIGTRPRRVYDGEGVWGKKGVRFKESYNQKRVDLVTVR